MGVLVDWHLCQGSPNASTVARWPLCLGSCQKRGQSLDLSPAHLRSPGILLRSRSGSLGVVQGRVLRQRPVATPVDGRMDSLVDLGPWGSAVCSPTVASPSSCGERRIDGRTVPSEITPRSLNGPDTESDRLRGPSKDRQAGAPGARSGRCGGEARERQGWRTWDARAGAGRQADARPDR